MPERAPLDKPFNLEAELQKYLKAYSNDPKSRAFAPLGETYRKMGKLDEAIAILEDGIKVHPNYALGHLTLGRCLSEKGDPKGAAAKFEDAIRFSPDSVLSYKLLAQEYKKLKDDDSVTKVYKRLLKIAPQDEETVKYLSAKGLYESPKRKAQPLDRPGEFSIKTPVEAEPKSPDKAGSKPLSDATHPQPDEANKLLREVKLESPFKEVPKIKKDRKKLEFYTMTLAEIYLKQGMMGEAKEIYETLLEDDPGNKIYMNALSRLDNTVTKPPETAKEKVDMKAEKPLVKPAVVEAGLPEKLPQVSRLESLLGLIRSRKRAL